MEYVVLVITLMVVIGTMTYGLVSKVKDEKSGKERVKKALKINLASFIPAIGTMVLFFIVPNIVHAAAEGTLTSASGLGFIGAALSTGLACIGAGYAVAAVGSSAIGAISEDPKLLGKTLIYVGLSEGIAIYGLIISIMILNK